MKVFGHRGARGLAPENTLASIKRALEEKVDGIEVDVRVTSDGVPVLFHDAKFGSIFIKHLTFNELRQAVDGLATLEAAIKLINRQVPISIEVKSDVDTGPVISLLNKFINKGWAAKHFMFGSFNQQVLRELHGQLPQIPIIVIESFSSIRASIRARELDTKLVCLNHKFVWWGFIKLMHSSGYQLYVYTLNKPKLAKTWAKFGLAGVVTDFPDRFNKQSK